MAYPVKERQAKSPTLRYVFLPLNQVDDVIHIWCRLDINYTTFTTYCHCIETKFISKRNVHAKVLPEVDGTRMNM